MKFKKVTDSYGYEWIINSDHVVMLEPLGKNEWEKGARLYLDKGSCERKDLELGHDSAMAVQEWLLSV